MFFFSRNFQSRQDISMQVKGFSAAAVKAGIRYPDRLDLGLIYSEVPAVTAVPLT